jgi:peptide/nickel transport system permease protein
MAAGLKKIFSNGKTIAGACILLFFILVAYIGPLVFPYDSITNVADRYQPSSLQYPFGTDWLGRDVFRLLIAGTSSVLETAFYAAAITVVLGTVLGILSGFIGGWVDRIIMSITNIFLSIPAFPVYLILAAIIVINTSFSLALIIAIWSWAGLCRAIRVQIMSLKERDFIQICTVMRMSHAHILFNELLPNVFAYIAVNFVMAMRNAIMASVGIMLVGLAAYDPTNWGAIMNAARMRGLINPQNVTILLYPLSAIILLQSAAFLLANGLDETLNPRLKVM